jgi:uncharacterized delta-60 repeat protein
MKKILHTYLVFCLVSTTLLAQSGSNDPTFDTGTGFNNYVFSVSIQEDDKIITGGNFTTLNGVSRNRIARLNANGNPDGTFDPGIGFNNLVLPTSIQADGKIIVGGQFTSFNGTARTRIARLNADGSLDATFNPGAGFDATVYSICIQADGKILVGGSFNSFNGTARNYIARLNEDGSLDGSFIPGIGFDNTVWSIRIQDDGKIVVGGSFNNYNGTSRNYIARLNTDGSIDATFNPGTGFNSTVFSVNILADGKIIVLGQFTIFNGNTTNRIALLNTDGSLDATFNSGTGFDNITWSSSIEVDGKIIVGGQFTSFNGTARTRIARLNADGSLDASFNPGTGFNDVAYTTNIQSNGKIIVGGSFTSFNGTPRNRIARLFSCDPITADAPSNVSVCDSYILPSLTVGNYFTATNGGGTPLSAGASITSTQTLYVYAANGSCTDENSFDVTITTTTADAPSNVSACDSYILPSLSVGNYYTATNGGGTLLNAGASITSTQTLYVYATNGSCSDENSFTVTITTTPTADAPSNVTACDSYILPSLSVGNYYTATNGGGTLLNAGDDITSTQTLYVYATNGSCSDENSFTVTINNSPSNTVTVSGNTLTANENGATYQWLDCDNGSAPISGATAQSFTVSANGNYAVEVTKNGCLSTSSCTSVSFVGINENSSTAVSVYPNPSTGKFTIVAEQLGKNYRVTDNIGKVVAEGTINNTQTDIDLSNSASGLYLLTIEGHVYKLVKQ